MNQTSDSQMYRVSIIILAAGLSSRMGDDNKLLLPYQGKHVLQAVMDEICAIPALEYILVTGHQHNQIANLVSAYPVRVVQNEQYNTGMTSSIQAGIRSASSDSRGYMICLSDMPLIQKEEYEQLLEVFKQHDKNDQPLIVIPEYQHKWGQPKIFSAHFKADILAHKEPNGCKDLILNHQSAHQFAEMSSDHILQDMDSPQAYREILARIPHK